jgi:TPR repeat protein
MIVTNNYSELDRAKINKELAVTFGRDIYGRQIQFIVTGFLGYSSFASTNSRFATFMEKCASLIKINNQNKPADAKAVVILQTSCDESEAFNSLTFLPQVELLAKTYYLVFKIIGLRGERLGEAINKIAKELVGRSIMTLIVRAHGTNDGMQLGDENFYTLKDVNADDFESLDPSSNIILDVCRGGVNHLAKKIAVIQSRPIFAYTNTAHESFLLPCCSKHGYGVVAFDPGGNSIAKIFTYEKGGIQETTPCCATNETIKKIQKKLFNNKLLAAKLGDAISQYNLGAAYKDGRGILQSYNEAAKWFQYAAMQGYASAQSNLGVCYAEGQGVPQSYGKAIEWYLKAAEQGLAIAQLNSGVCCLEGRSIPQSNENGIEWYRLAVEQGYPAAQYNLGFCYYNGDGVPQNYEIAAELYRLAAAQGYLAAQYNLGACYYHGHGVLKSYKSAVEWFQFAAEQGHIEAQYNLGVCYYYGQGIDNDIKEAIKWFRKASERGYESAKNVLEALVKK